MKRTSIELEDDVFTKLRVFMALNNKHYKNQSEVINELLRECMKNIDIGAIRNNDRPIASNSSGK